MKEWPQFDSKLTRFERYVLFLALLIVAWQVVVPPIVGLAENGDFPKIIRQFDMAAPSVLGEERWFTYLFPTYYFNPANQWVSGFASSETLLLRVALGLNWLISKDGAFDIRVMGVTHAALFLLAMRLFLPVLRNFDPVRRLLLAFLAILIFCDVMYVCYYNAFYMDTAGFLFLLLACVFFVRGRLEGRGKRDHIGFYAASVLLLCAKPIFCLLGLPLALLAWRVTERKLWARLGAGALILASLFGRFAVPSGYSEGTVFNVIFHGLLPHSSNPSRELRQLGLDDSYRRYIGMNTYSERSPMGDLDFIDRFSRRTSHARLAYFYARHPMRAFGLLLNGLDAASVQRPHMGTFPKSAGLPPYMRSEAFAAWSKLKESLFGHHPAIYLAYAAVLMLSTSVLLLRIQLPPGLAEGFYALCGMTLLEMLAGAMADTLEMERHMFPFNLCLDLVFLSACAVWVHAAIRNRRP